MSAREGLRDFSFASLDEARAYLEWYDRQEYTTGWDDLRFTCALAAIEPQGNAQSPVEGK